MPLVKPGPWAVSPGLVAPEWRWFWKHCVFAALPGADWQHSLHGRPSTLLDNGFFDGLTKSGSALRSASATSGGAWWAAESRLRRITNQHTLIVFAQITSVDSFGHLLCVPYDSGADWDEPWVCLQLCRNDTNSSVLFGVNNGGVFSTVSSASGFLDGELRVYGAQRRNNIVRFFRDGRFHSTATNLDSGSVDWSQSPLEVHLGNRSRYNEGEGSSDGRFVMAAILDQALSDSLHRQLGVDPFGPFREDPARARYPRTTAKRRLKFRGRR